MEVFLYLEGYMDFLTTSLSALPMKGQAAVFIAVCLTACATFYGKVTRRRLKKSRRKILAAVLSVAVLLLVSISVLLSMAVTLGVVGVSIIGFNKEVGKERSYRLAAFLAGGLTGPLAYVAVVEQEKLMTLMTHILLGTLGLIALAVVVATFKYRHLLSNAKKLSFDFRRTRLFSGKQKFFLLASVKTKTGYLCEYCGGTFEASAMAIDHIKPYSKGGHTVIENAAVACHDRADGIPACNRLKSAKDLDEWYRDKEFKAAHGTYPLQLEPVKLRYRGEMYLRWKVEGSETDELKIQKMMKRLKVDK